MAASDLQVDDAGPYFDLLDLADGHVARVPLRQADALRLGADDPQLGRVLPTANLVSYSPGTSLAGVVFSTSIMGPGRAVYGEVNTKSGAIGRTAELATIRAPYDYVDTVGVERAGRTLVYTTVRFPAGGTAETRGAEEVAVSRLTVASLKTEVVARVRLPGRRREDSLTGDVKFPAAGLDPAGHWLAFAEYWEEGMKLTPPARLYVVDLTTGASFSLPAPSTTYGFAYSPDGKYLYVGSAESGVVSRIDLAKKAVDLRKRGPQRIMDFVVGPGGKKLVVVAQQRTYTTFDLPDLSHRTDAAFPGRVGETAYTYGGGGLGAPDGHAFFLPEDRDENTLKQRFFELRIMP
jgi:hypothetical protein